MIGCNYDANDITGIPIKNREAATLTEAWTKLNKIYEKAGVKPKLWVLDNEISHEFKKALTQAGTTFQLVPPRTHRSNAAERGIQT